MGHVSAAEPAVADLLRELAPRVLGVLVRRNGNFDDCEDAVQEALLAATVSWPVDGVPTNPTGWLITTASRRLVETWRKESARRRREDAYALEPVPPPGVASAGRRHVGAGVLVLSPRAVRAVAGCADAARARRPDHRRDRARSAPAGGDGRAAHQPGEGAHPRYGRTVSDANRSASATSGCPRCCGCCT